MKLQILKIAGIAFLPVLLFVIFSNSAEGFGSHSISIILSQSMIPAILGFAMAMTMRIGHYDFSPGARMVFAAVFGGILEHSLGFPGLIIGCIAGGLLGGLIMATLYRTLRIPAMVVSLGVILIFEVVAAKIAGGTGYIEISPASTVWGGQIFAYIVLLIAAVLFYIVLYNTKIGCHLQAIGNDEKMVKNIGMNTEKVKFIAYIFTGLFCGLAAILQIRYSGTITSQIGMVSMSMMFKPMIGVVIGVQLSQIIKNLPLLILIGEISIAIIFNGFIAMGLTDTTQNIVLGLFLIIIMSISESGDRIRELFARTKKSDALERA